MTGVNGKIISMTRGQSDSQDDVVDFPLDNSSRPKNPWPPVVVFVSLLVFIYKMTELFVR